MLNRILLSIQEKINKITKRDQLAAAEARLQAVLAQGTELDAKFKASLESFAREESRPR